MDDEKKSKTCGISIPEKGRRRIQEMRYQSIEKERFKVVTNERNRIKPLNKEVKIKKDFLAIEKSTERES